MIILPDFETSDTAFSNSLTAWFKIEKGKNSLVLPVSALLDRFSSYPRGRLEKEGGFRKKKSPPGAVFLGGLPDNPMVNLYNRPLGIRDFHKLFNLSGFDHSRGNQNDVYTQ